VGLVLQRNYTAQELPMFKFLFKSPPKTVTRLAHSHNWELVACNDEYCTTYDDTNNKKVFWKQRFYKCNCGARKHEDNRESWNTHGGIEQAKKNWIDAGVVPGKSYFPSPAQGYVKPPEPEAAAVTPLAKYQKTLEDIQATMLLVTRNIDLEEKYPELKESYLKHMELYRELMIAEKLYDTGKK